MTNPRDPVKVLLEACEIPRYFSWSPDASGQFRALRILVEAIQELDCGCYPDSTYPHNYDGDYDAEHEDCTVAKALAAAAREVIHE
jgi:hypothetical protein